MQGLLILAGVCYATRVTAYTLFQDPWLVLTVEPLHGITFAFKQIAAVHYCAAIAPPGFETSAQGFKDVVVQLGVITGTFGGGAVMQRFGSVVMFRCAAGMVAVAMTCFALANKFGPGLSCEVKIGKGAGGGMEMQRVGSEDGGHGDSSEDAGVGRTGSGTGGPGHGKAEACVDVGPAKVEVDASLAKG